MNQDQAILISKLLNNRGFIIDEDINDVPVSYTKVESWISENEELLRRNGYYGGPIIGWSSGFRGSGCAYGVTDTDREVSDEWIDRYCLITQSVEGATTSIEDIIKYNLTICFECSCGHTSSIAPEKLPTSQKKNVFTKLKGRCTKCSSTSVSPIGLSKPWKKT